MSFILYNSDCLEQLKLLEDNSVDSIVTDPPYGLSFMGKKWDYDVPSQEIWAECLRVLKPGGHLLSFAGTRTQHRMAVRIEDAGFEIRDMIAWVYGSGFPKSLDVSKALDKANGKHERDLQPFCDYVKACRMAKGWSLRQLDEAMGTNTAASWWEGRKSGVQPPGLVQYQKLKGVLVMDDRFDELIDWLEAEREVVGKKTSGIANKDETDRHTIGASKSVVVDITAPATEAARQWQGWGTALKPALEPITVARKPLVGTVAENVLAHGTGAINIDGCRVDVSSDDPNHRNKLNNNSSEKSMFGIGGTGCLGSGRWPANLIHDGSNEVVGLFPNVKTGVCPAHGIGGYQGGFKRKDNSPAMNGGDNGSAARFFYCAKASKKDRDEGLDGFEEKLQANAHFRPNHLEAALAGDSGKPHGIYTARANNHPTVKPTDLMRYLCRLVTPPNGIVLDPFMGSGSTGKAAMLEGFQFIGIEREAEYVEIAKARIENALNQNQEIEDDKQMTFL